jgi:uncharacterized protein (DUF433 family)
MTFDRITVRADKMGGVPCIRGLRIPVATVVGMIADGMERDEILAAYPDLEPADIEQALRYAADVRCPMLWCRLRAHLGGGVQDSGLVFSWALLIASSHFFAFAEARERFCRISRTSDRM